MQDFPNVPKSAKYEGKVKPDKIDWDKIIKEAVEAGKEVPEIDWVKPGADAALEVGPFGSPEYQYAGLYNSFEKLMAPTHCLVACA